VKRLALRVFCAVALGVPHAYAEEAAATAILRAGCTDDVQRLCAGVQPGGGRVLACLKEHRDALSDKCKQAAQQAAGASGGNPAPSPPSAPSPGTPPSAKPTPPSAPTSSAAPSSSSTSPKSSTKSSASAGGRAVAGNAAPGSYLLMKKAQVKFVLDSTPNAQPRPVLEMLIPTTWEFTGEFVPGSALRTGCYSDYSPIIWQAKAPDGSGVFQNIPDYSWQYSDDSQEMQRLNDPYRRARGPNGQTCPVSKPLTAEQFFRENLMGLLPKGATIVSIDPYPELNAMVRQQLGLGPHDAGDSGVRTDAIRARVEFQADDKTVEAWLTAAVVMRTLPVGNGHLYDLHAIDLMSFTAPKGKLTGNDKLLRVMMTSIRLTPEFSARRNKTIAGYYQTQADKEAKIDQINARLQQDMMQIYQHMSDNAARVSRQGYLETSQGIRGVQSFRDPTTGTTMELSDQYDHAWLNGADQYVMSNDPNFNPNAQLSGNWNELQAVRPSP
jgi:hypothetical protein